MEQTSSIVNIIIILYETGRSTNYNWSYYVLLGKDISNGQFSGEYLATQKEEFFFFLSVHFEL